MSIIRIVDGAIEKMNRSRAPRFDADRRNVAIQDAVRKFINERHASFREKNKSYELTQRIKDDLRLITRINDTLIFSPTQFTLPSDYDHELGLELLLDGIWTASDPTTQSERQVMNKNFHTRGSMDSPFHYLAGNTVFFDHGPNGTVTQIRYTYTTIYPYPYVTDTVISASGGLTIGKKYGVLRGNPVVHDTITYTYGEVFTATLGSITGTGTVIECEEILLPFHTHMEVQKMMAAELSETVENYSRKKSLEGEMERQ